MGSKRSRDKGFFFFKLQGWLTWRSLSEENMMVLIKPRRIFVKGVRWIESNWEAKGPTKKYDGRYNFRYHQRNWADQRNLLAMCFRQWKVFDDPESNQMASGKRRKTLIAPPLKKLERWNCHRQKIIKSISLSSDSEDGHRLRAAQTAERLSWSMSRYNRAITIQATDTIYLDELGQCLSSHSSTPNSGPHNSLTSVVLTSDTPMATYQQNGPSFALCGTFSGTGKCLCHTLIKASRTWAFRIQNQCHHPSHYVSRLSLNMLLTEDAAELVESHPEAVRLLALEELIVQNLINFKFFILWEFFYKSSWDIFSILWSDSCQSKADRRKTINVVETILTNSLSIQFHKALSWRQSFANHRTRVTVPTGDESVSNLPQACGYTLKCESTRSQQLFAQSGRQGKTGPVKVSLWGKFEWSSTSNYFLNNLGL